MTNRTLFSAEQNVKTLQIDSSVYRLTAVKKSAYKFLDRASVRIWQDGGATCVELTVFDARNADAIVLDFYNELLDQELRQVVEEETCGVRNLLLAQAFSSTNLILPELDSTEFSPELLASEE